RLWPGRRLRPRGLSRYQSRGRAADGRAHAESLSRPPRLGGRKLFGLHPPSRGRRAENAVRNAGGRMTQTTPPPIPTLIPDSAPFSVEQRTWLNGFFAGLLSLDGGVNALSSEETAALMKDVMGTGAATARGPLDDGDDGRAPWHDPGLPIGERMQLAESRPLRRRMMAAMGQQDCGQCGYNCEDYANAIVAKNEERLNLCVPGGKDTARMLKTLYAEFGAIPATAKAPATVSTPATAAAIQPAPTRDHPTEATFVSRTRLNKPGSQKETWHIDIDLARSGI